MSFACVIQGCGSAALVNSLKQSYVSPLTMLLATSAEKEFSHPSLIFLMVCLRGGYKMNPYMVMPGSHPWFSRFSVKYTIVYYIYNVNILWMEEILHHRKDGRNLTSNRMDHLSRRLLREWLVRQPTEPGAHEGFPSQVRRGQVHLAAGISWWFTYGWMGNPGILSWFHGDLIGFSGIQWDLMVQELMGFNGNLWRFFGGIS